MPDFYIENRNVKVDIVCKGVIAFLEDEVKEIDEADNKNAQLDDEKEEEEEEHEENKDEEEEEDDE